MHIQTIIFVIYGNCLSISYNTCQDTDNMMICNSVLFLPAIVTTYDIIIFVNFYNTVQNVLSRISLVQWDIIFFQSASASSDKGQKR